MALDPRNSEALTLLATRLADTGKATEALDAAKRAVDADPLSRSALMSDAKSLIRVGKLEEGEKQYRSVTELYPDFSEARYQLGMSLAEGGRLDLAEPWLKAAIKQDGDPLMAFQASWLYTNLGLPADSHKMIAAITASPGKELGEAGEFADRGDWAGMLAYGKALQAKSKEPFWPMVASRARPCSAARTRRWRPCARRGPTCWAPTLRWR